MVGVVPVGRSGRRDVERHRVRDRRQAHREQRIMERRTRCGCLDDVRILGRDGHRHAEADDVHGDPGRHDGALRHHGDRWHDPDPDPDTDAHPDTDTDAHPYTDTHTHPYTDTHTHADTDTDADAGSRG